LSEIISKIEHIVVVDTNIIITSLMYV